jgi:hypothetical protein
VQLESLEVPVRVFDEVEVELRQRLLDDTPHRLAEVGHEPHHAQHRCVRLRPFAEVAAQQLVVGFGPELVVDREVREVEEDVAHPGVLPVDDPEPSVVDDEVRAEEIVVARPPVLWPAHARDPRGDLGRKFVGIRNANPALGGSGSVDLDHLERIEPRRNRRASWKGFSAATTRAIESGERISSSDTGRPSTNRVTKRALVLEERHDLRSRPDRRGSECGRVLGAAVDPEHLGVLAADAKYVRLAVERHLEVVVRDASAERLDRRRATRPQARRK